MLMYAIVLIVFNDIGNITATLYSFISGINLDYQKVTMLTRQDYLFSKLFAIPHVLWCIYYSLCFLGYVPIDHPPTFVQEILFL